LAPAVEHRLPGVEPFLDKLLERVKDSGGEQLLLGLEVVDSGCSVTVARSAISRVVAAKPLAAAISRAASSIGGRTSSRPPRRLEFLELGIL
jgi:hypothetical protein